MFKGGYRVYKRLISSSGSGGVGVRVFEWGVGVFCSDLLKVSLFWFLRGF